MYKKRIKRVLDIAGSLAALPFLLLLLAAAGPIIHLGDKGPVFFCGLRIGKDGKRFKMYKLRSMTVGAPDVRNADGSTYSAAEDPRVTRIGRFLRRTSLDELPQLFNVLKGDMSLVGPRPDLPEALNIYNEEQRRKLKTRPGITGFSQAYFRNSVNMRARFDYDVYYTDHITFALDMMILLKTVGSVLGGRNLYSAGGPTGAASKDTEKQTVPGGGNCDCR